MTLPTNTLSEPARTISDPVGNAKSYPTVDASPVPSADITGPLPEAEETFTGTTRWQRFRASSFASPTVILALAWLTVIAVWTITPGLAAPGDPISGDVTVKLQPPSSAHWFGTDQLGRDIFTRVVHGTGLTVKAVLIAVGLGFALGGLIGAAAGFLGGWVDAVLMRVADVLLSIPSLLLSLAVIVALGFGTVNVAIAVGIGSVASVARVMRSEVLKVRNNLYIEAATAAGATRWRVLWRHALPNSLGPVIVLVVLESGTAVLAISSLSFLGYGAPPPAPEWGALVSQGRDYLAAQGWISTIPGLVITATVLSVNRLSNALNRSGIAR